MVNWFGRVASRVCPLAGVGVMGSGGGGWRVEVATGHFLQKIFKSGTARDACRYYRLLFLTAGKPGLEKKVLSMGETILKNEGVRVVAGLYSLLCTPKIFRCSLLLSR